MQPSTGQPSSRPAYVLLAALASGWAVILGALLLHRLVVSNDALSNYAHAWYVAGRLRDGHGIPYHFPLIGHGDALAFPYGFLPWVAAAVLRLAFGDWATTLMLVLGALALLAATRLAFPELRAPGWCVVLANPFLLECVILFQLPFAWAMAMLFAAVAAWRRGHVALAVLAAALAQGTHAPLLMPLTALLVAAALPFEAHRRRLVVAWACATALAAPAAALVLLSPVVADTTLATQLLNLAGTIAARAFVLAGPFIALAIQRRRPALPLVAVALLAINLVAIPLRQDAFGWGSLVRRPDHDVEAFVRSPAFEPGATYRVLRAGDGKVSMYQVLTGGGRLDSEFFPESIDRRSFPGEAAYVRFLEGRDVDYVILFASYTRRYDTNEYDLLMGMANAGRAAIVFRQESFAVFRVRSGER